VIAMKTISIVTAIALWSVCGVGAARAQTDRPDADDIAGSTAALVGMASSGILTLANLNYSPEGHAVATALAGVWWLDEAETTRGDVIGGVIVASGAVSVLAGARSIHQSSRSQKEKSRSVRMSPVISVDHAGKTRAGVMVVASF
jgi:drug/metabolite transporter superfamily protein YnfA